MLLQFHLLLFEDNTLNNAELCHVYGCWVIDCFAPSFWSEGTWRTMEETLTATRLWGSSFSHTDIPSSSRMLTLYATNWLAYILPSTSSYHQFNFTIVEKLHIRCRFQCVHASGPVRQMEYWASQLSLCSHFSATIISLRCLHIDTSIQMLISLLLL